MCAKYLLKMFAKYITNKINIVKSSQMFVTNVWQMLPQRHQNCVHYTISLNQEIEINC